MANDIEAYISGELPPEEQARFEAAMAKNPALREEVERLRELTVHLHAQHIREVVTQTLLDNPPAPDSFYFRRKWQLWVLPAVLVLLLAGGWWLYNLRLPEGTPGPAIPPVPAGPPPEIPHQAVEPPAPVPDKSQPIAQQRPTPGRSRFEGMTFTRGDGDTLSADLQKRLEKVWFTAFDSTAARYTPRFQPAVTALGRQDFATAFIELGEQEKSTPGNDTLSYLKGYCLLELFDGDEAARYLNRLDAPGKPWRAEALWYSGLGYLLTGEREMTKTQWEKVLALPEPVWRKNARNGLQQLKK